MRRWAEFWSTPGLTLVATLVVLAFVPSVAAAQSQGGDRTIWEGVYTAEQAERGSRVAQMNCLECHSTSEWGSGRFLSLWSGHPVVDLYDQLRWTMPFDEPGRLTAEEYADVVAYMLSLNEVPTGNQPLPSDEFGLAALQMTAEPPSTASPSSAGTTAAGFDPRNALAGASDVHVHAAPDSRPRSIDVLGLARLAQTHGMRAIVLKNHYEPTAAIASLVRQEVPGIEVFGGVALNAPVGGINPAAVEHMANVEGGWGRVVWMPTLDSENQVRRSNEDRPFVPISRGGELLPEVREVVRLIAEHNLVLATGHSTPDEVLMLLRHAREQGVGRMIVTHAMFSPVLMTVEQMKAAAAEGAFLEFPAGRATDEDASARLDRVAEAIREIGPGRVILSSDGGQSDAPTPPESFTRFLVELHARGFTEEEMAQMVKQNPARLLGLPLNDQLPAPYETTRGWGTLPDGREWGPTGGNHVGVDGRTVWVIDRCGTGTCTNSELPPIIQLSPAGEVLRAFGEGHFIFPHGLYVDAEGNVWVTDARGAPEEEAGSGRGNRVIKFSPEGEVLLVLGDGPPGDPPNRLNEPNAAITAPNGDIFVAESHSAGKDGRITKWAPDGSFIKSWGSRGSARGQFIVPHALAMDSQGRLFVADRFNYRIQIFDQDGNYIDEWKQFGQPSGIYIDPNDVLYVTDSHSWGDDPREDGEDWRKGIRIGSARTGHVRYFLPDLESTTRANSGAEGITADGEGNVWGAIVRRGGNEVHRPLDRNR